MTVTKPQIHWLSGLPALLLITPVAWGQNLPESKEESIPINQLQLKKELTQKSLVDTATVDFPNFSQQLLRSPSNQYSLENTPIDTRSIAPTLNLEPEWANTPGVAQLAEEEQELEIQPEIDFLDDSLEQITNVNQLRDVSPRDWAYEALRNLVETYGCIAGYPDGTFRGNRAMTRYEFAAGVNACLQQIERLIAAATEEFVTQEDLAVLQRLREEFAPEIANLATRVDNLEDRTAFLENNQFSTTAIIGGEVILALSAAGGGDPPGTGEGNPTLNHLTRLQLVSSFTGKDRLRMELSTGNFTNFGFGNPKNLNTNTALLSFQQSNDNNIDLSMLEYRFAAFNDRVVFTFRPVGFSLSSVLTANSPYFDTGRGAISRFGEANPVFKIGNLDSGVGMDWLISNRVRLQVAYGAKDGDNPGSGFFLGENAHATGVQLLLLPADNLLTGISYIYGYSPDGRLNTFTGSAISDASGFINQRSSIHAVSGTLQWRLAENLTFSTWGGVIGTYGRETDAFAVNTNYMFSLGITDLFQEGSLLALMFGQPPKLVEYDDFSVASGLGEDASSHHIEAFYRFKLRDNIFVTPGFFIVTNPGNIEDNNSIWVGTIRTTFRF